MPERGSSAASDARVSDLLPVALLAALAAVQTFATGDTLVLDARVAGVAVAAVALLLRAPFLVVVGGRGGHRRAAPPDRPEPSACSVEAEQRLQADGEPGRSPTPRTASSTPGMNDARS